LDHGADAKTNHLCPFCVLLHLVLYVVIGMDEDWIAWTRIWVHDGRLLMLTARRS
jgi:hypothetical protein